MKQKDKEVKSTLSADEIRAELEKLDEKQFKLSFKHKVTPLANPMELRQIRRDIARLKTWIRGTHSHVSSKHLNRYLAEFSYRFNRRFKQRRDTIFDRLVTACCDTQTVTYQQLVSALN